MSIPVVTIHGDVAILNLGVSLGIHEVPVARKSIRALIDKDYHKIIIDLTEIEFIDSAGLGVLVGGLARHREKNFPDQAFLLVVATARIMRIFEMTWLVQIFEIVPSLEEACKKMNVSADSTKS